MNLIQLKKKLVVTQQNNQTIASELENLQNSNLTPQEVELKKAVLEHLIGDDYDRIQRIRENYPIEAMLDLLADYRTAIPIDLKKLFA